MSKFTVNHITIRDKGQSGPWGYALVSPAERIADIDVFELRGLGLETYKKLAKGLPRIKAKGLELTVEAEVRTEKVVDNFLNSKGEPTTSRVLRIYLESTPVWNEEVKKVVGEGNLSDILGDDEPEDAF